MFRIIYAFKKSPSIFLTGKKFNFGKASIRTKYSANNVIHVMDYKKFLQTTS